MVKLKAPLLSRSATGKLGSSLQFARHARGTVAGRRRHPTQPRTIAQLATRILMTFLSNQWNQITPAERATWLNYIDNGTLPPYNGFIKYNVNQIKNSHGIHYYCDRWDVWPAATWPATKATLPAVHSNVIVDGLVRAIRYRFTITTQNDNWLTLIHRKTTDDPLPSYRNLIGIFPTTGTGVNDFTMPDQEPGSADVYHCNVSRTGDPIEHYSGPRNCTVLP